MELSVSARQPKRRKRDTDSTVNHTIYMDTDKVRNYGGMTRTSALNSKNS